MEQTDGSHHVPVGHCGIALEVLQIDGEYSRFARPPDRKGERNQVGVPTGNKGENGQRGDARLNVWHHDLPPDLKAGGAVDQSGPFHVPGNIVEKALHYPDAEGQLKGHHNQGHPPQCVEPEAADEWETFPNERNPRNPAEYEVDGNEQGYTGKSVKDQGHGEEGFTPSKLHSRQGVAGQGRNKDNDEGHGQGNHQGVSRHPPDTGKITAEGRHQQEAPVFKSPSEGAQALRLLGEGAYEQP